MNPYGRRWPEVVMVGVENGKHYGTNDIGAAIRERFEVPIVVGDLFVDLMRSFEVNRGQCESCDTVHFRFLS